MQSALYKIFKLVFIFSAVITSWTSLTLISNTTFKSEMNDLLTLSDRIMVMAGGKISKEFDRNKVTQEEIFKASVI